ncbi:MAG: hypothetical protein ACREP7_17670 [Lysobacter sp.]
MRLVPVLFAIALACAGAAVAAPAYDFPTQIFDSATNSNVPWTLNLRRIGTGKVIGKYQTPTSIRPQIHLQSVEPVLDLGVLGVEKGQYGLTGTIYFMEKDQRIRILVQASDPKRRCQYKDQVYADRVIVAIGDGKVPVALLYGCGLFASK